MWSVGEPRAILYDDASSVFLLKWGGWESG
jgi:hypothetical protein